MTDIRIHKPENIISSILFNFVPDGKIITASNVLIVHDLKQVNVITENPKSHDFTIRAVLYNPLFKCLVSACEGGVINVWVLFITIE